MDPYAYLFDPQGNIRPDKVDDLLVEVISGKHIFSSTENPLELYATRYPTSHDQDQARIVYVKRLKENIARGIPPRATLEELAIQQNLFVPGERAEKVSLLRMLERQRAAADKTTDPGQKGRMAIEMEITRKRIIDIELREFDVLQNCAEVRAEESRVSFYVSCCTFGGEMLDDPVWPTWQDFQSCTDWGLISDARHSFNRVFNGLPVHVIRALALTTEWRIRWKSAKEGGVSPFGGAASDWDRNKVNLIYWSDFYDNIYQHPECPDDGTIRNETALQNWLNLQIAKRKQQNGQIGGANRPAPTYIAGGQRKQMVKLGADKVINVGQPYKIRS